MSNLWRAAFIPADAAGNKRVVARVLFRVRSVPRGRDHVMVESQGERFEHLVLPHLNDAFTLAVYLLRDEHDAQDVVQDASLRAVRFFDGFVGDRRDARAWLLSIVRNCCYSWSARRRAERDTLRQVDDPSLVLVDPRATDDRAIAGSERARLERAIAALPVELREVLVLRELSDLSYREISEVAGIPMGTVMSRLSRARERLALAFTSTPTAP